MNTQPINDETIAKLKEARDQAEATGDLIGQGILASVLSIAHLPIEAQMEAFKALLTIPVKYIEAWKATQN